LGSEKFGEMLRLQTDPPAFEGGSMVPIAAYLLIVAVLSGLAFVSTGASPSPLLGMGWGLFLVAVAVGAAAVEGVSPRSLFAPPRSFAAAIAVVAAFWALYNLAAYGLALGGVAGFAPSESRVVAQPLAYLAALLSAFLFTAVPEELAFRGYLQSRLVALAGRRGRWAVAVGVAGAAALFALFHLPRWFLMLHRGAGVSLAVRLFGVALAGVAYGLVYALTGNVWLVALFHATMNQPPFLVTVHVPATLHLPFAVVEYGAILALSVAAVRLTGPDRPDRGLSAWSTIDRE
jgi:membrane protease YdiL (CAAX protease family)